MIKPGDKFGNLIATYPIKGGKYWKCECKACGNTTEARKYHLEHNLRTSCGCRKDIPPESYTCITCKLEKPRREFYLRKNGRLLHRVCKECKREEVRIRSKDRHHKLRIEALKHYGGDPPHCQCCGEQHIEFLHIDHEYRNGNEHRKELKSLNIYRWLKQNNYPSNIGLRVLCANCNLSLGSYGYCPHQPKEIVMTHHVHDRYRHHQPAAQNSINEQNPHHHAQQLHQRQ